MNLVIITKCHLMVLLHNHLNGKDAVHTLNVHNTNIFEGNIFTIFFTKISYIEISDSRRNNFISPIGVLCSY